jgi:hypothetical protein
MKPTAEIIKELVQAYQPKGTVKSFVNNLDGTFTATICPNVFHSRVNSIVKINNIAYNVISFTENTVKYSSLIAPVVGDVFEPPVMKFFNGTPFMINSELSTIDNFRDKLPMFYLYEVLRDRFVEDVESSIERESSMRWFVMDEAQFDNWDTNKHYSNTIKPMFNYWFGFKEYLKKNKLIGLLPDHELVYHAKFGISINQNGHVKQLIPDEVSGVEVAINLAIKKTDECTEC